MAYEIVTMLNSMASHFTQFLKELKFAPIEKLSQYLIPAGRREGFLRKYHLWRASFQLALKKQMLDILSRHPSPRAVIVFTPSLDWQRQLFQRPQQLAQALAKRGALVFYTQITPIEGNTLIKPIRDRLYLCSIPLEQFSVLEKFFVYSLTWNRKYLLKFGQPHLLYDYVDDLLAFAGDHDQLRRDHFALLQKADLVTATARQLHEDIKDISPEALYVPNGVDFEHFHSGQVSNTSPQDIAAVHSLGKPIIGFYGAFANWLNYDLLVELVQKRPDLNFVLIGPKHDNSLESSGLLGRSNVHYLGPKPYLELPAYLAFFDTAILPFKVNQLTQATSPIKLFEYFAGGKPVVSTPLREVMQFAEVCIGGDCQEFSQKLNEALTMGKDAAFTRRLQEISLENTWEMRAECILKAIENRLAETNQPQSLRHE